MISGVKGNGGDGPRLSYEIGVGLSNLANFETRVLEVRAKVGARLNVIDSQKDTNQDLSFLATENLSRIEDLDLAEAITKLSQIRLSLEAAQQSYIKIQSLSLFNYLR